MDQERWDKLAKELSRRTGLEVRIQDQTGGIGIMDITTRNGKMTIVAGADVMFAEGGRGAEWLILGHTNLDTFHNRLSTMIDTWAINNLHQ